MADEFERSRSSVDEYNHLVVNDVPVKHQVAQSSANELPSLSSFMRSQHGSGGQRRVHGFENGSDRQLTTYEGNRSNLELELTVSQANSPSIDQAAARANNSSNGAMLLAKGGSSSSQSQSRH